MAPLLNDKLLSGIIRSGSNSIVLPRPWQDGHAPRGLLKENMFGSSCSKLIPHFEHAECSLKRSSLPPTTSTTAIPFPCFSAVATESASLSSMPGFIASLSTTTSISCFCCLLRLISSESSCIVPSTRPREKPEPASSHIICLYSPFLCLAIGARTWSFTPSVSPMSLFTICSTVCGLISLPQLGQCCFP